MSRTVTFEIPVDTSLFTPVQLQPRAACWFAMTGWARWLREHWVSFPQLIRDHQLGVVIATLDLEYCRPFDFFEADTVVGTSGLSVRANGKLLILTTTISPPGGNDVARVTAVLRPVAIADGVALAATPTRLDLAAPPHFAPDEIVDGAPMRRMREVIKDLVSESPPIALHGRTFTLHRHLCEAADQWSGIALADLTTEVREELVALHSSDVPALAAGFVHPMRRITLEFRRAAFFLDEFSVECRTYESANGLAFVHRLARLPDDQELATFVEWFTPIDRALEQAHGIPFDRQLLTQGGPS